MNDRNDNISAQLPCNLSRGVTATREGIDFSNGLSITAEYFGYDHDNMKLLEPLVIPWHVAAERLRYRSGEPWCFDFDDDIMCVNPEKRPDPVDKDTRALGRLASIIADNGAAFRVLHWCLNNLSGINTTDTPQNVPERGQA